MDVVVYGNLMDHGIEVVRRGNRLFVRYDAGAHVIAWREDEITEFEYMAIAGGGDSEQKTMFQVQRRLEQSGVNPYIQNWKPSTV
jgi:hypothetical protein